MKIRYLTMFTFALFTLVSATALAQTESMVRGYPVTNFADLDKDLDGELTKEEAKPEETLVSQFERYDEDGDGTISMFEYRAYSKPTYQRDTETRK